MLDVDVAEQAARHVTVRTDALAAPPRTRRRRGGAPEDREVDDGRHRTVGHEVDELAGVEEAAFVVVPPGESLVAHECARAEIDHGLDVRTNPTVTHCDRELVGDRDHAHCRVVVEDDGVPRAHCLGAVHRGVGAAEELCGLVVRVADRDAEARGDIDLALGRVNRVARDGLADAVGQGECGLGALDPVEQQHELVAAEAGDGVGGAHHAGHAMGQHA